jgi:hypothetical protein
MHVMLFVAAISGSVFGRAVDILDRSHHHLPVTKDGIAVQLDLHRAPGSLFHHLLENDQALMVAARFESVACATEHYFPCGGETPQQMAPADTTNTMRLSF